MLKRRELKVLKYLEFGQKQKSKNTNIGKVNMGDIERNRQTDMLTMLMKLCHENMAQGNVTK